MRHSISELGETGSEYEHHVSYFIFMPVGTCLMIIAFLNQDDHYDAAYLSGAMGASYFLSAFFPCDLKTPLWGSRKNSVHNIAGGVCYALILRELIKLSDNGAGFIIQLSTLVLIVFLIAFVIAWPKPLIGLFQRIAEAGVVISIVHQFLG